MTNTTPLETSRPELWENMWEQTQVDEFEAWVQKESNGVRGGKIFAYVEKHLGALRGLKTIEVGSGPGIYSMVFARKGAKVTLLDYSQTALKMAEDYFEKANVPADFRYGDAFTLDESFYGKFDVAMSFGTIEHYRYPDRFKIAKIHLDLVKPGGIVAISVPNQWFFPHEILKAFLIRRKKWFLGYEGAFSRIELKRLRERLLLENAEIAGSGFLSDMARYRNIFLNLQMLSRWVPQRWKRKELSIFDRKSFLDDFLGSDLVLLGIKPRGDPGRNKNCPHE